MMSVNVCCTLRISAVSSVVCSTTSGASAISATRYGSVRTQRTTRMRGPPWIRTRSVPSGTRIIRATTPSTPTSYRSSGEGVSASVLRLATIAIERSPRSTSLISSTLRGWPTLSGMSMSGNVTVSRSGSTPTSWGSSRPAPTATSRAGRSAVPISIMRFRS